MLQSLTIHNYLFVEHLHLDFMSGFSALTGETGAGKSILLDALSLVLGHRLQQRPTGATKDTVIIAAFHINAPEISTFLRMRGISIEEDILLVKRVIDTDNKTRAFLNDQSVSLSLLKELSTYLIDIHGQFDHLWDGAQHLKVLDLFGGLEHIAQQLAKQFAIWRGYEKELGAIKKNVQLLQQEKSWLEHAAAEIEKVAPQDNEEEHLLEQRSALMGVEEVAEVLANLKMQVGNESRMEEALHSASRLLQKPVVQKWSTLEECSTSINAMLDTLDTVHQAIERLEASMEDDLEDKINILESRLFTLRDLARKHRCGVYELPALQTSLRKKLDTIAVSDASVAQLEEQLFKARVSYEETANHLSTARRKVSRQLTDKLKEILRPLKLPHVQFEVVFEPLSQPQWTERGIEKVEFWVSLNPGMMPGPLKSVVSGGELSRLMLGLKVLLREQNSIDTLIFDEIDTGLGGAVAAAMGKYLKKLSVSKEIQGTQVIAITHSPQLAAYADCHIHVQKVFSMDDTRIHISHLKTEEEKVDELARMLSGASITPQTKAAAQEMRQGALYDC